jgi:hypothetical protein
LHENSEAKRFTRSKNDFNELLQNPGPAFQRYSDTIRDVAAEAQKICECFQLRLEVAMFMALVMNELARRSAWRSHLQP